MKRIGVFLSSAQDVAPVFMDAAEGIGQVLAKAGFAVVYGGSSTGSMGSLAQGVIGSGGRLIGVVPEMDFLAGIVQPNLTEKIVVPSLSERKGQMIRQSDAFLVLPGGLGTLDEALEVLALRQIDVHRKPVIFYNYLGYWSALLECFETYYQQRMITKQMDKMFVVLDQPSTVIRYLDACFPN